MPGYETGSWRRSRWWTPPRSPLDPSSSCRFAAQHEDRHGRARALQPVESDGRADANVVVVGAHHRRGEPEAGLFVEFDGYHRIRGRVIDTGRTRSAVQEDRHEDHPVAARGVGGDPW